MDMDEFEVDESTPSCRMGKEILPVIPRRFLLGDTDEDMSKLCVCCNLLSVLECST